MRLIFTILCAKGTFERQYADRGKWLPLSSHTCGVAPKMTIDFFPWKICLCSVCLTAFRLCYATKLVRGRKTRTRALSKVVWYAETWFAVILHSSVGSFSTGSEFASLRICSRPCKGVSYEDLQGFVRAVTHNRRGDICIAVNTKFDFRLYIGYVVQ